MASQSEAQLEQETISRLVKQGYEPLIIKTYDDLEDNFRFHLNRFNNTVLNGDPLSDSEFRRFMVQIEGKNIFKTAKILRDKVGLQRDDSSMIYLELFNRAPGQWDKNVFQVTSQTTVTGIHKNRYDVLILINGLPVIQIELKRRGVDFTEAFNQVKRYKKHSHRNLLHFLQLFVVSNGVETKYFANSDGDINFSSTFYWSDAKNKRIDYLEPFIQTFLDRSHVAKMLTRYMVLKEADERLLVMRPYQVYGVEAMVEQALNTGNNGFLWHTTGSGKTLTSFKASKVIADSGKFKKVFFLVDRKDLDKQTADEFNSFSANSIDRTNRTGTLVAQVEDPDKRLILTTIQKMSNAVKNKRFRDIMDTYKDEPVAFVIDECHRSTFGDMHKVVKKHFSKAQYFGFTGTPRFEENKSGDGRSTADLFGKCLHSYLLPNSISDKTTLPFSVEYVKTADIIIDDADDTKASNLDKEEIWGNPERINKVAGDILKLHPRKSQNGRYNALLTVQSIRMLMTYYEAFKRLNKQDMKIAAIFTYNPNEETTLTEEHVIDSFSSIISDYNATFATNFTAEDPSPYFVDVQDKMKSGVINLLLVVDMCLTGFDSPKLNTLYVDRNLQHHGLLQAFSRTNRVEGDKKTYGNIRCYRALEKNVAESIKMFSDTHDVNTVLTKSYDEYMSLMNEAIVNLKKFVSEPHQVNTMGENGKKEFILRFREVAKLRIMLEPFAEFEFDTSISGMTEREFDNFRSKYLAIYRDTEKNTETLSVLNEVDFMIEEIYSEKINVDYIMNLLGQISLDDKDKQSKDIELIISELDRADSEKLILKADIIRKFLKEVVPNLRSDAQINNVYIDFLAKEYDKEIENFAVELDYPSSYLGRVITDYEITGNVNRTMIMDQVEAPFPLSRTITSRISEFILNLSKRYAS